MTPTLMLYIWFSIYRHKAWDHCSILGKGSPEPQDRNRRWFPRFFICKYQTEGTIGDDVFMKTEI